MIIAAAQTSPSDGNIQVNLTDHIYWINKAAAHKAQLIMFPEMSLTGYQREGAAELAFVPDDERLVELTHLSRIYNMVIIVGAPVFINSKLYIGSIIITPLGNQVYTKQYLHSGEEKYFDFSFVHNPIIKLGNEKVIQTICADINWPQHAADAAVNGATIYTASIFFDKDDMGKANKQLQAYAKEHAMNVLMANYAGSVWGLEAGGGTAFWNKQGERVGALDDKHAGLLLIEITSQDWKWISD